MVDLFHFVVGEVDIADSEVPFEPVFARRSGDDDSAKSQLDRACSTGEYSLLGF